MKDIVWVVLILKAIGICLTKGKNLVYLNDNKAESVNTDLSVEELFREEGCWFAADLLHRLKNTLALFLSQEPLIKGLYASLQMFILVQSALQSDDFLET